MNAKQYLDSLRSWLVTLKADVDLTGVPHEDAQAISRALAEAYDDGLWEGESRGEAEAESLVDELRAEVSKLEERLEELCGPDSDVMLDRYDRERP